MLCSSLFVLSGKSGCESKHILSILYWYYLTTQYDLPCCAAAPHVLGAGAAGRRGAAGKDPQEAAFQRDGGQPHHEEAGVGRQPHARRWGRAQGPQTRGITLCGPFRHTGQKNETCTIIKSQKNKKQKKKSRRFCRWWLIPTLQFLPQRVRNCLTPKQVQSTWSGRVLMSNWEMIAVSYRPPEPALHGRERELRDQNHRLWLRPPQAARQSAPEDSLLHAAVRRARDPQIRRLRRVLRPVESGGYSGEWLRGGAVL